MKSIILYILTTLLINGMTVKSGVAQKSDYQFWNRQMNQIAKSKSKPGWVHLREEANPLPDKIFEIYPDAFGLRRDDEMRIAKVEKDKWGFEHFKYQQYYKGIPVVGAESRVHHNGTRTYCINGNIAHIDSMDITPSFDEKAALSHGLSSVNATARLWEMPELIANLQRMKPKSKIDLEPKPELVICMKEWKKNDFDESNLVLAYKMDLNVLPITESKTIFVDAHTGEIIFTNPLSPSCSTGSGQTTWHGEQTFKCSDNEDFYLDYDCGDRPVIGSRFGDPVIPYEYFDLNNNWTDGFEDGFDDDHNDQVGVTTYFYLIKTYDYYDQVHGRQSYDDDDGDINGFSENSGDEWLGYSSTNAMYHAAIDMAFFGQGGSGLNTNANDDWNTLDIVAHELTHGFTYHTAGLFYNSESGALNESFSDIFGELTEEWFEGSADWLVGADIGYIRNFSNPNDRSDPDTYEGDYWYDQDCFPVADNDYCGVHTNSGVQNFWFYLLSEGGSGVNDYSAEYEVEGIGIDAAADIAFRVLTVYLGATSGFSDAREAGIQAAEDLFGNCSFEAQQVGKAWHAVGVGDDVYGDHLLVCGNYDGLDFKYGIHAITAETNAFMSCFPQVHANIGTVVFTAGNYIDLKPEFEATVSSAFFFDAVIDPCAYTYYAKETNEYTEGESQPDENTIMTGENVIALYPVPADQSLSIEFYLKQESATTITLLDLSGRTISVLKEDEWLSAGKQHIDFSTSKLAAGVYLCAVKAGNEIMKEKFIVQH